jgi:hypothetical protein
MKTAPALLAIVILMATGCSGSAGNSTVPTSAPAAPSTSVNGPSAWPTASAIPFGAATLVAGEESCALDEGTLTSTGPDGTEHWRNGSATCSVTNNDPRVAGGAIYTWNHDFWNKGPDDGAHIQWGAGRLENSGGAWAGTYSGMFTSETGDVLTFWYTGTGGYKGLSYYMWQTVPFEAGRGQTHGLIFPGTPPKL